MTRPMKALSLSLVVLLFAATATARAPEGAPVTEGRIQLARQAAATGDTEQAIRIYKDVLSEDPSNERAFWGLAHIYSSSGMYDDDLIPMLLERLSERPEDRQAAMELGQAYASIGDREKAHAWWSTILEDPRTQVGDYLDIGTLEIRNRMFEQALETFTAGRKAFHKDSLFSQELVAVLIALGDFGSAMDECLVTVDTHGGAVQWATNQVELMLDQGASRGLILDRIDEVADDSDSTVDELGLAGSVYLVLGQPDRALEAFLNADDRGGGRGEQLMEYAAILRDQGLQKQARSAYLMVTERHPGESAAARAGIAAARLLVDAGDPEGAVDELRAVADAFGTSNKGAEALYRAARVELDDLHDAEAALATVSEMRSRFGERARRYEHDAVLIEVDAYMMEGRFDEAHERAGALTGEDTEPELRERAEFARGFSSFLEHDYDRATSEFKSMIEADAAGELVNDGLRLMLAIAQAKDAGVTEPVDLLADAQAARLTGDRERARDLLESVAEARTGEAVQAEALLLLGSDEAASGHYGRAIEYYDRIIRGIEAITPRAEAMMRKADILSQRGDRSGAMEQYLALIEELPDSILTGEARRKLDRLRRGVEVEG
jgi:tetratricopeptide (TPR) repeat protein